MSCVVDLKVNYKSKMIGYVDLFCLWYDSLLQLKKIKKGIEFMYCVFYLRICFFIVWGGLFKVKLWSDFFKEKMSEDVVEGLFYCKCDVCL